MENFDVVKDKFTKNKFKIDNHLTQLQEIIQEKDELLEGNCFYEHLTFTFRKELYPKQINLFWAGCMSESKICEIGFNAGHSALLFLMANPTLKELTVFDICSHSYTFPCIEYIVSQFPSLVIDLHCGNSLKTMPLFYEKYPNAKGTYDIVHVDGGHTEECIQNDMKYADILVKVNGILIIDDTNNSFINIEIDKYLQTGNYEELKMLPTPMYPHRILKKILHT